MFTQKLTIQIFVAKSLIRLRRTCRVSLIDFDETCRIRQNPTNVEAGIEVTSDKNTLLRIATNDYFSNFIF